jgi:hypothetical protein
MGLIIGKVRVSANSVPSRVYADILLLRFLFVPPFIFRGGWRLNL